MTAQAFEFDGPRGYRLAGRLEWPDDQPAAALVGRGTFNVLQRADISAWRSFRGAETAGTDGRGHPAVLQATAQLIGVAMA